jgi:hypothetical protein
VEGLAEFTRHFPAFNPFPETMKLWIQLPAIGLALLLSGCLRNGVSVAGAETDDAVFNTAMRFKREGQPSRALASFREVIARRGDDNAPESHLEAGIIYLQNLKQPIRAYYHLGRYLELKPNSLQRALVQGQMEAAVREFVSTLPGRAVGDMEVMDLRAENERLRRENDQLRSQVSSALVSNSRISIVPQDRGAGSPADIPQVPVSQASQITLVQPNQPAPVPTPQPRQSAPPAATAAPQATMRSHTVAPGDTLWSIATRYFGTGTNANVQAIRAANASRMTGDNIQIGMVLEIPPAP